MEQKITNYNINNKSLTTLSSDGTKLIASSYNNYIYTSSNSEIILIQNIKNIKQNFIYTFKKYK